MPSIPQSSNSSAGTVSANNNFSQPGNSVAGSTSNSYVNGYMNLPYNATVRGAGFLNNHPMSTAVPVANSVHTSRREKVYTKKRSHDRKEPLSASKRGHVTADVNAIPKKPRGRPKKATTEKNMTTRHAVDSTLRTNHVAINTMSTGKKFKEKLIPLTNI